MQLGNGMTIAVAEDGSTMAESLPLRERMDEATFHAFYRETAPRLWSYIRREAGNAALADDILQETFYRFLRADLPLLEQPQMKAYLYRTAMALLSDHWRRLKREQRWSLHTLFRKEAAENLDLGENMARIFRQLKPQERALLWLAYVEGCDHREIGAALDIKEKSVRVLLYRARKKLSGILTEKGFGPEVNKNEVDS